MKLKINVLIWTCVVCVFLAPCLRAQAEQEDIEELKKKAPKIFVDCDFCDIDHIRREITFVNYVWDRKEADVHILVTLLRTGSGGWEYTLAFIGQKEFDGMNNTLKYYTSKDATEDEARQGLVEIIKKGLMPYVANTPISDHVSISFKEEVKPTAVEDKWNFWVFSASLRGFFDAEKSSEYNSIHGSFSANRTTEEWKINTSISASYNESNFEFEDETLSSTSESRRFSGLIVKSLSEHWSIGGYLSAVYSTYSNIDLRISPAPAIEYNVFPYSQSTRRQLRFLYRLNYSYNDYIEETMYGKSTESLWQQSLSATLELKERWGEISTTLRGSHYFHDWSKNSLTIFSEFSIRIIKGLRLSLFGSYAAIHDQLALPSAGATPEEILLRRRELATTYRYFFSVGFSYSFGSIFSNVVNPRFGGGGGGFFIY
ncbi:MAG: DUF481 domain-containing protein [Candidatus Aminicenantes bacterium]|nr:DUF481 domain-containing protein [Candidatus Aminicenantes bacterium]